MSVLELISLFKPLTSKHERHLLLIRHLRHLNFYITLNTNKCFPDREDPEQSKMSRKLTRVLESALGESELPSYVQFQDSEHKWSKQWIKSVRSQSVVEVGGKKHCLHSHSLVCIAHYSNVYLKLLIKPQTTHHSWRQNGSQHSKAAA